MPWADFLEKYPKADIFLKGITDPDEEASSNQRHVIETVVSNIINSGFRAAGQRTFYTTVLKEGKLEGDCGTLSEVFLEIMEGLNIKEAQAIRSHTRYRCLVTKPAHVLGGKKPNVDNGMWCFEEHYWIEVPGRQVDLLFGGVDPKSLGLEEVKEIGEEDGCPYFQFETMTPEYSTYIFCGRVVARPNIPIGQVGGVFGPVWSFRGTAFKNSSRSLIN